MRPKGAKNEQWADLPPKIPLNGGKGLVENQAYTSGQDRLPGKFTRFSRLTGRHAPPSASPIRKGRRRAAANPGYRGRDTPYHPA